VAGRLADGLSRAKGSFGQGLRRILTRGRPVGADLYEELTETLILGDTGVAAATAAVNEVRRLAERTGVTDAEGLRRLLAQVIAERLGPAGGLDLPAPPDGRGGGSLGVILVVGVNGTGKTTTVAKLAARLQAEGRHPLLAQADTFRAAATEQTLVWAGRLGLDVVHHRAGSDPAAVAFDGVRAATARGNDVLLVDTAGRLHTKTGLIEELKKVARILGREVPGAPHERLLVLDGTAGLNSLEQARVFGEAVSLTGIVITKLDGTARGGVVLAIREQFGLPVKFVGVGEGLDDLVPFDPEVYAGEMLL
jgi:fused signal recognition particle receptor